MFGQQGPKNDVFKGFLGINGFKGIPNIDTIEKQMNPMMLAGALALFDKYDADKNGVLSEAELNTLKADADKAAAAKQAEFKAMIEKKKAEFKAMQEKKAGEKKAEEAKK